MRTVESGRHGRPRSCIRLPLPRLQEALGQRLCRASARWPVGRFTSEGASKTWIQHADSGNRITHHFCPECGCGLFYAIENKFDGLIAIPLGAFDDPFFASPKFSVWEERKNDWVSITGEDVDHSH